MRYEIKKILSCKILMISMIVAFIFSMAISYNAYANEKINLTDRRQSAPRNFRFSEHFSLCL